MKVINSSLVCSNSNIAIVIARVNYLINKHLLDGAIDILERVGKVNDNNISIIWVPGAYELPLIIKILSELNKFNAIIAIASIISGFTKHFKYLANTCIAELNKISVKNNIPITSGILVTDNIEQAIERSGIKHGNKGSDAALSALEMINIVYDINHYI